MSSFNIKEVPSQKGRIAIVTGANIGLGYETALAFAKKELKVIMACRNVQKAEQAKKDILSQSPNAELEIMPIDLSKLQSVKEFAKTFTTKYDQLDLLVNNAGVMMPPYSKTEDGFELQFGANYLGHFLLTGLLMDMLLKTPNSRVVSLSSNAHKQGKINFDDLQSEKSYSKLGAYNQSKLACLMFTYALQRKLEKKGATTISVAAHPGASITNLDQHIPKWVMGILMPILKVTNIAQSAEAGAEPTSYAALGKDVKGGDYFGPGGFGEFSGRAKKVKSTKLSHDEAIADRLWKVSEELTNFSYS
ncbi:MAG: SDR family NAD(P)-dependent oxidoreductase [Bacteroidetes bacterium]|nr:SDR family NAD(P)-dependent oxidoreductase [Bacteroidota bacterium]